MTRNPVFLHQTIILVVVRSIFHIKIWCTSNHMHCYIIIMYVNITKTIHHKKGLTYDQDTSKSSWTVNMIDYILFRKEKRSIIQFVILVINKKKKNNMYILLFSNLRKKVFSSMTNMQQCNLFGRNAGKGKQSRFGCLV